MFLVGKQIKRDNERTKVKVTKSDYRNDKGKKTDTTKQTEKKIKGL